VATLLGVPEAQVARTAEQASVFVRAAAPTSTAPEHVEGAAAVEELLATLRTLPERASAGAPEPLLSRLRHAARRAGGDDAGGDDEEALLANAVGLLFQAHDATAGLIGNTLLALARHPELADAVRAAPALLPDLLREVARHDAPVQNTRRFVAEDTAVLDRELRAGDAVLLVLAAANRDPAANPEPERLLPTRREARCFTFGLGRHACIGEMMAVAIAAAGVGHILEQGGDPAELAPAGMPAGYRPSVNARIPRFAVGEAPTLRPAGRGA
jgi:cytochrome P450